MVVVVRRPPAERRDRHVRDHAGGRLPPSPAPVGRRRGRQGGGGRRRAQPRTPDGPAHDRGGAGPRRRRRPDPAPLRRGLSGRPPMFNQATNGGIGGISSCWVFTCLTPGTARATSTARSSAAVPSSVTTPPCASTVMR